MPPRLPIRRPKDHKLTSPFVLPSDSRITANFPVNLLIGLIEELVTDTRAGRNSQDGKCIYCGHFSSSLVQRHDDDSCPVVRGRRLVDAHRKDGTP